MDEKKQDSIQSSDNQEMSTPEVNVHHNNTENIASEGASDAVEHEQIGSKEESVSTSSTSGSKSGVNKKVVGAAVVVVAAVVGGAVYMTQQSQNGGMWLKGNSSSRTQQLAEDAKPDAIVSTPEAAPTEIPQEASQAPVQAEETPGSAVKESETVAVNEGIVPEEKTAAPVVTVENVPAGASQDTEHGDTVNANPIVSGTESGNIQATVSVAEAVGSEELAQSPATGSAVAEDGLAGVFKAQLDQQTEQINQLKAELQQMQKQYTELLEQRLSRADVDVSLFVVNDVARLVQSADNELSIAGNLPNAVRALEMARQTIQRANNPILSGLAGAVSSDIVMLKSAPVMNEETLFKEVGKLIELLDKAPLVSPDRVDHLSTVLPGNANSPQGEQDLQVSANPDLNWYEKAWEEVKSWPSSAVGMLKSDLGGLVRVEKLDDPTVALISAGQAAALKNNLKLDLRFAQQGLLNAQQGIWTSSLEAVQAALLKYYNQDAPETRNALAQTRSLLAIPVRPQLPQITHSVKAIEETRNQIINLGKPQE
ncbi:uroporphyrinogen-III C-methyltransferase [Advenella sp. RU8]|uniref:uroporphyrinogen-III C-methyltransferase n=1 Tax=Advenella sp. RU8 TaxID=3399575 RepID=UPI003AAE06EA